MTIQNRIYKLGLGILVGGLASLYGFSLFAVAQNQPSPAPNVAQGQRLPITAQAIIHKHRIDLEVARTPEEQEIGLMYRTNLPANRGMLFPFEPARPVAFWMKNTLIPLDMVFLYQGTVRTITSQVPPCKQTNCPTYTSNASIDQVIELRSGRAEELGLKVGDQVQVKLLPPAKPSSSNP